MLWRKIFLYFIPVLRSLVIVGSMQSPQLLGQVNSTSAEPQKWKINDAQIMAIPAFVLGALAQGFQAANIIATRTETNLSIGYLAALSTSTCLFLASYVLEKDNVFIVGQGILFISLVPLFFLKTHYRRSLTIAPIAPIAPLAAIGLPIEGEFAVQVGVPLGDVR